MSETTILIADDHPIVRKGLRSLLRSEPDFRVLDEAPNGCEAVRLARICHPNIVLMDLEMPSLDGCEATRQLMLHLPHTRVIILSAYATEYHLQACISAGACGYLLKQTAAEELLRAVRQVRDTGSYFSPSVATQVENLARYPHLHPGDSRYGPEVLD